MMDPRNLKTMQTLDLNSSHQNIYINSITPRSDNASEKPPKLKRKKVTIIKKKYNRDGSVEKIRQDIYKNYGSMFAKKESVRLGSTLTFHHGSQKQFDEEIQAYELRRDGMSQNTVKPGKPRASTVLAQKRQEYQMPGRVLRQQKKA